MSPCTYVSLLTKGAHSYTYKERCILYYLSIAIRTMYKNSRLVNASSHFQTGGKNEIDTAISTSACNVAIKNRLIGS